MSFDLFNMPPTPKPAAAPAQKLAGTGIKLRWYQRQDVDALMHAIETGHKHPCCVAATGLGKAACIAELAGRRVKEGKVLCLVDRAHLVGQLADEIERHLPDTTCGRIADSECADIQMPIVVATVQSMYTPDRSGRPLYEYPQFRNTKTVIPDEGHRFFADVFRSVLTHFSEGAGAITPLFTATPVASNGAAWESFVDWTAGAEGPCMRTVNWGARNGYLVPMRQAFVHVDLDISAIYDKLAKAGSAAPGEDADEEDDGGDELAKVLVGLLEDKGERAAASFAAGVAKAIGRRQAIIFSPPRVKAAQLIASWLNATRAVRCEPVWGARVDKHELLARFKRGTPQALSNVGILVEGFDNPDVSFVFICRLLKKWRMACQMVGRAMRPLRACMDALSALDDPDQASEREAIIAGSAKPDCIIADLIGQDGRIVQASAVDVLYSGEPEDVRHEIAEVVRRRDVAPRPEREEVADEVLEEARRQLLDKQHEQLAEMARRRAMTGELKANVTITFDGEGAASDGPLPSRASPRVGATLGEKAVYVAFATNYDADTATNIANKMPRIQLRGMTQAAKKRMEKAGGRPDWRRARQAFPEWAAMKDQERKAGVR